MAELFWQCCIPEGGTVVASPKLFPALKVMEPACNVSDSTTSISSQELPSCMCSLEASRNLFGDDFWPADLGMLIGMLIHFVGLRIFSPLKNTRTFKEAAIRKPIR